MHKTEVIDLFKRIKRHYPMFPIPDDAEELREVIKDWHEDLEDVPFEVAKENLRQYKLNPDNKFPPHVGVLATCSDFKSEIERYHEHMHHVGVNTLEQFDQFKKNITGPSEEQRRKVRELLGK